MLFDDAQQPKKDEPPSYIDAHTHSWLEGDGVLRVRNIFPDADCIQSLPEHFSIGIHPFNMDESESVQQEMKIIRDVLANHSLGAVALGECGLDHFSKVPLDVQERIFKEQISMAEESGLPLVIHAVRAWSDIIRIRKETGAKTVWLAHGFRSSPETAADLIEHGIMLSFGEALLNDRRTAEILEEIPEDSFLLETDESAVDIREIYQKAAEIRELDMDELRELMASNFNKFRTLVQDDD